jgi:hypothetical protein
MFTYFTKINNKDILDYKQNSLYFNEDDRNDDDYLFNTETIAKWGNLVKIQPQDKEVVSEDIPPLFSYS